jgi:hypothetical protein
MSDGDIPGRLRIWADGLEIVKSHAQALMARTAADEIERLRVERDEARKELCYGDDECWQTDAQARERARRFGWDCFKEDSND